MLSPRFYKASPGQSRRRPELYGVLPDDLREMAQAQGNVLSSYQLRSALTNRQLELIHSAHELVRLWHGMWALPEHADSVLTKLAAADITTGFSAVACLHTAADLYGFNIENDNRLHVVAMNSNHSRSPELVLHRCDQLLPQDRVQGRMTISATETAVNLAARMPGELKAVAILDAALRQKCTNVDQLSDLAADLRIRNIRRIRTLIPLADAGAESPPESWLRLACIRAGLPKPVTQHWVTGSDGQRYRFDLAWPEYKVACEYDSVEFHTGTFLAKDRRRQNALVGTPWKVISVTATSFWQHRDQLMRQIAAALRG